MDMTAPSGKFWMAMPMARVMAAAAVIVALPLMEPASTTPTACLPGCCAA
jgi:hypothetical protein